MLRVCITGATGFIGRNLLQLLEGREDIEVVALSRKITKQLDGARKGNVCWRRCNGFSMIEVEHATKDVDVIIYLIHSMLPTSSLAQGSFQDYDLYLADNFARAAKKNGVKKIIYLSGLIPKPKPGHHLSQHLESRKEVESVLAHYGVSVTTLRAALVVGKNGSSFKILEKLVKRLPGFICPAWTGSKCQPIDLHDVLFSLNHCIENYESLNSVYDIGGPDILSYREMLLTTAEVFHRKRFTISVPFLSPKLSRYWVSRVTGTPAHLVYPLVESLIHDMVVREDHQLKIEGHAYTNFKDSIVRSADIDASGWEWSLADYRLEIDIPILKNVTSMQRMVATKEMTALEVSEVYFKWLSEYFAPLIHVENIEGIIHFKSFQKFTLLKLKRSMERGHDNRVIYYLHGGLLSQRKTFNGRFEFRWIESSQCFLLSLMEFRPALAWFVYKFTQAIIHLFTMNKFRSYLKKLK